MSDTTPGTRRRWAAASTPQANLQYRGIHWQPIPIDRAIHVDARKV
jgi:hypothetical protein